MQHSNIVGEMRATLLNLQYLGVNVIKDQGSRTQNNLKRIARDPSHFYPQSRWIPLLQDILEYAMNDKLDLNYCACTRTSAASSKDLGDDPGATGSDTPAKSARGWKWRKEGPGQAGGVIGGPGPISVTDKATVIVFIMGGVTYAELRVVYELMTLPENRKYADNYNIVIGSTDLLTPAKFFNLVGKLPPIVT